MSTLIEKWVPVPDFPGYEISNLGQIVKIGKTKRIPIKVNSSNNYIYASLSYAPYKTKQINVKQVMDKVFDNHVYKDSSVDDLDGEIWRDVVGWLDSYQVSNLGRIRTKERVRHGKNGTWSIVSSKIKETYIDEDGYMRVSLYEDNKTKLMGVHRVVAEAFVPNPNNLPQVNHINGLKTDNRAENLEWVTNTQNIRHSIELGLRDPKTIHPVVCVEDDVQFKSIADLSRHLRIRYNKLVHMFKTAKDSVCIDDKHYRYF